MNIGDAVNYYNAYDEKVCGIITEIASDMDSYEEVRLENGIPMYYSKKLFRFVPVKEKNIDSVFLTVETVGHPKEFLALNELL
jgi:hypothetical protein|tara:strand:+ start:1211 stop:1459 length:249 start_codon:yes stop_codon:yes gene_type:complete